MGQLAPRKLGRQALRRATIKLHQAPQKRRQQILPELKRRLLAELPRGNRPCRPWTSVDPPVFPQLLPKNVKGLVRDSQLGKAATGQEAFGIAPQQLSQPQIMMKLKHTEALADYANIVEQAFQMD